MVGAHNHVANGSAAAVSAMVREFFDTLIAPHYKCVKNAKVYVRILQMELAGTAIRRVTRAQVARMVVAYRRRGLVAA
jgi:flavorubredoxin